MLEWRVPSGIASKVEATRVSGLFAIPGAELAIAACGLLVAALPLKSFMTVQRAGAEPHYGSLALSYACGLAAGALDLTARATPGLDLTAAIAAALALAALAALDGAAQIAGRTAWRVGPWGALAATLVATAALHDHEAMAGFGLAPSVALLLGASGALAAALYRRAASQEDRLGRLIAIWTVTVGLSPLVVLMFASLQWVVLGYLVAGANAAAIGLGAWQILLADSLTRRQDLAVRVERHKHRATEHLMVLSHELRTPLHSLRMGLWGLGRHYGKRPEQDQEVLAMLLRCTENLEALVENLVHFSQYELDLFTVQPRPDCYARVFREAAESARLALAEKGVQLSVSAPSTLPGDFDAIRLRQVLTNLLGNAEKFTEAGDTVFARLFDQGEAVRIEIEDTGIGIPAEKLGDVFERFYQVDRGASRRVGGLGLGLAVCKLIVEEGHRGRIWAASRPGGGTTFTIVMPRWAPPSTEPLPAG